MQLIMKWLMAGVLLTAGGQGLVCQTVQRAVATEDVRRVPLFDYPSIDSPMPFRMLAYDRGHELVYATLGSQVWVSRNKGQHWTRIDYRDNGALYFIRAALTANGDDIHMRFERRFSGYPIGVLRIDNGEMAPVELPEHISSSGTLFRNGFLSIHGLSVLFMDDDTVDVQWPGSTSWEPLPMSIGKVKDENDRMYSSGRATIGLLLTDTSTVVFSTSTKLPLIIRHPRGIQHLEPLNDSLFLAWKALDGYTVGLMISRDRGISWEQVGAIRGEKARVAWLTRNRTYMVTTNMGYTNLVDSTGSNIRSIGRAFQVQETDSALIGARSGAILTKEASNDTFMLREQSPLGITELVAISEDELVSIGSNCLYYSKDGGRSWVVPTFDDSLYHPAGYRGAGISMPMPARLQYFGDRDAIGFYPEVHAIVHHYPTIDIYAAVSAGGTSYLYQSAAEVVSFGMGLFDVRGLDHTSVSGQVLQAMIGGAELVFDYTNATPSGQSMYFLDSTGLVVFSDSMYVSRDTGRSWQASYTQLPRGPASIVPVSSFITTRSNMWCTGHRGFSYAEADTTVVVTGGIYASEDSGTTWRRSFIDVDFEPYVWQLLPLASGTIVASIGHIVGELGPSTLTSKGHYLVRSTDGGRTFTRAGTVEERDRSTSVFGHRIVEGREGGLFAIGSDVILESRDDGISWDTVYVDGAWDGLFTDIAVPSDTCIWLGSKNGVVRLTRSTPTGIFQQADPSVTSLLAYPTPTRDQLSIKIRTQDAPRGGRLQLKLCSLLGETVCDLSDALVGNSGPSISLSIDLGMIPGGVYILELADARVLARHPVVINK
ncbi:MAG: exo-alpha-sialidase [Bacteroidetes bacterium]|nr:exo-alpha-sialidase [Bacteroidota bacterium]